MKITREFSEYVDSDLSFSENDIEGVLLRLDYIR